MSDKLFEKLSAINVNDHTEQIKQSGRNFTYLSWAWAWSIFKKACPDATYEIKENPETHQHFWYDHDLGYEVRTSVTAEGVTHEMWLPVMDSANHAMKDSSYQIKTYNKTYTVNSATMFDVNKAIMRCLVKNLAMFGLGLYIYSGEDLPEGEDKPEKKEVKKASEAQIKTIKKLYTNEEIKGMIQRISEKDPEVTSLETLSLPYASKMIKAGSMRKVS